MNLKKAKKISNIFIGMFVAVWLVDKGFPELMPPAVFWTLMCIALGGVFFVDIKLMKCPYCGTQIGRFSGEFCDVCGKHLDK